MFMVFQRRRGTSTRSSSGSKTSTALRMLVTALTLGGQALAQTSCGCQFDHACFPADGSLLKDAVKRFGYGTWDGKIGDDNYGLSPSEWCTGEVTNMEQLFIYQHNFDEDISLWDVSSVTDMNRMFFQAFSFTGRGGIGSWDVSKVENMRLMFYDASSFTGEGIEAWDVSSVTDMRGTFLKAPSFAEEGIGSWNVLKVTDMAWMFGYASSFKGKEVAAWEVSSVTTMYAMFTEASSFTGEGIGSWDVSKVTSMWEMFIDASSFNQNLCEWREKNFPYYNAPRIFKGSGCTFQDSPNIINGGPFCADDCAASAQPSMEPSVSVQPSSSSKPSMLDVSVSTNPSEEPSSVPSSFPSSEPSSDPSIEPSSEPSGMPSETPSSMPSSQPSSDPSGEPSSAPSSMPSSDPSSLPSSLPSLGPSLSTKPTLITDVTNLPSNLPSVLPTTTMVPSNGPSPASTCDSPKLFSNINREKAKGLMFQMSAESSDVIIEKVSFETKDDADSEVQLQVYFKLGSYADVGAGFPNRGMDAGDWGEPLFDGIPKQISNGLKEAKLDDAFTITIPKGKVASFYLASNKELTFKKGNEEFDVSDEGEDFKIYTGLAMENPFQNILTEANFFGEITYCTGIISTSTPSELQTSKPSASVSDTPSIKASHQPSELPTDLPSSVPSDTPSAIDTPTSCEDRTSTVIGVYSQHSRPDLDSCWSRTDNLLSIIAFFRERDTDFATFESDDSIESFDIPDFETKLRNVAFFLMPDMEGKPATGWGTGPQNILRNYVSDGGVILVTGLPQRGAVNFLNDIFSWDLASTYCFSASCTRKNVANSAGTVFSDGPEFLAGIGGVGAINCNSVDCTVMYGDESAALVTVIKHGDGSVIVLGFDYHNTGYEVDGFHRSCPSRSHDWVTSIFRSSLLLASECPQPSTDRPSYQPSISIQPSQSPSYLRCDCEFDHKCFPADGVLLKKAADAFCAGTWDSSHPDFADHGPIEEWCTGLVTNMSRLFIFQTNVNADLSKWNTAAVVNMRGMFSYAGGSFSSTIGSWDVSSVKIMGRMFDYSQFSGDISNWNTASVKNMAAMFRNAASFNSDISGWNVASVTSMWSMFRKADNFNSDISGWTVSSVNNMALMFDEAASFNIDLAGWDLSSIAKMHSMFRRADSFNQNLCAWKDKNFPYGPAAYNIFKDSGCKFTEDPDETGDNGGPFCAHDCSLPPFMYTTSNVDVADNFARGVMYTISAKSKQVTIKGLGVLGRKAKESNIRMYYQNGSYLDFEAFDVANWIQVFRGNVMLEANEVVTIPLTQEFTIPAGGSVSVYVVSPRGMSVRRVTENEEEFDVYAETDSFVLKVGVSTRKVFNERIGLAEFAGTIVYEV